LQVYLKSTVKQILLGKLKNSRVGETQFLVHFGFLCCLHQIHSFVFEIRWKTT